MNKVSAWEAFATFNPTAAKEIADFHDAHCEPDETAAVYFPTLTLRELKDFLDEYRGTVGVVSQALMKAAW